MNNISALSIEMKMRFSFIEEQQNRGKYKSIAKKSLKLLIRRKKKLWKT
jgi:hypothetical protein